MTTVMTWGNSDGVKGRCDAKCHGATTPRCNCMCGGAYHGASNRIGGLRQAIRDTWQRVAEDARARAAAEGVELRLASAIDEFRQLTFLEEP